MKLNVYSESFVNIELLFLRSAMLIIGPHWCNIACIRNLILSNKSVTPAEINFSIPSAHGERPGSGRAEGQEGAPALFRGDAFRWLCE